MAANNSFLVLSALRNAVNIIHLGRGSVKNQLIKKINNNTYAMEQKIIFLFTSANIKFE